MSSAALPIPTLRSVKLLDRLRKSIRPMHHCLRMEETCVQVPGILPIPWLVPSGVDRQTEVAAFVAHLATDRQVPLSAHGHAWSALQLLHGKVLEMQLP
jgi:hypothetical protein